MSCLLQKISIHALRVEGDNDRKCWSNAISDFYPRPPGGGRHHHPYRSGGKGIVDFYPRPPGGGRRPVTCTKPKNRIFLSTPSGWRATKMPGCIDLPGEFLSTPSGWRATANGQIIPLKCLFLSTPSGWRATSASKGRKRRRKKFLSTPSGWRATHGCPAALWCTPFISIHALRVEGDKRERPAKHKKIYFYPRPPGGGRRCSMCGFGIQLEFLSTPSGWRATYAGADEHAHPGNFYPRPPGGGRHTVTIRYPQLGVISIHALRVEGDARHRDPPRAVLISIHALRVEGDFRGCLNCWKG